MILVSRTNGKYRIIFSFSGKPKTCALHVHRDTRFSANIYISTGIGRRSHRLFVDWSSDHVYENHFLVLCQSWQSNRENRINDRRRKYTYFYRSPDYYYHHRRKNEKEENEEEIPIVLRRMHNFLFIQRKTFHSTFL